ncbi:MAG: hypothetical protein Crog4KO_28700 [Crocinitomicaceae bacterium]
MEKFGSGEWFLSSLGKILLAAIVAGVPFLATRMCGPEAEERAAKEREKRNQIEVKREVRKISPDHWDLPDDIVLPEEDTLNHLMGD